MNECFNPSFLVPRYGHVVGTLWARCGHVVGMLWDKSADSIPALSMRIKQAFDLRGTKQDPAFSIDEMKCAKPLVGRWSLVVGGLVWLVFWSRFLWLVGDGWWYGLCF